MPPTHRALGFTEPTFFPTTAHRKNLIIFNVKCQWLGRATVEKWPEPSEPPTTTQKTMISRRSLHS